MILSKHKSVFSPLLPYDHSPEVTIGSSLQEIPQGCESKYEGAAFERKVVLKISRALAASLGLLFLDLQVDRPAFSFQLN